MAKDAITVRYNCGDMAYLEEIASRFKAAGSPRGFMVFAPTGFGINYRHWDDAIKAFEDITVKGRSCMVSKNTNGTITIAKDKLIE